jgi:hypothetical protein
MLKRAIAIIAALTIGLAAVGVAQAKPRKHRHSLNVTVQFKIISSTGVVPQAGSTALQAGVFDGRVGSLTKHGAIRQRVTFTPVNSSTFTFKATGQDFDSSGSANYTANGTGHINSDGTTSVSGSGKYTGGTGTYKGGTGRFTFSGTVPPPTSSAPVVETVTGHLTY